MYTVTDRPRVRLNRATSASEATLPLLIYENRLLHSKSPPLMSVMAILQQRSFTLLTKALVTNAN